MWDLCSQSEVSGCVNRQAFLHCVLIMWHRFHHPWVWGMHAGQKIVESYHLSPSEDAGVSEWVSTDISDTEKQAQQLYCVPYAWPTHTSNGVTLVCSPPPFFFFFYHKIPVTLYWSNHKIKCFYRPISKCYIQRWRQTFVKIFSVKTNMNYASSIDIIIGWICKFIIKKY